MYDANDLGVGVGGISISIGGEIVKYYTSAANVMKSHFYGVRYEMNASGTVFDISIGVTAVIGRYNGGFTIGIGSTWGVDAMPFNAGFNVNKGITTDSFKGLKDFGKHFWTPW